MTTTRRLWPALLVAPSLVLVDLTVRYALVTPSCQAQAGRWLHAVALLFTVVVAALLVQSTIELRRVARERQDEDAGGDSDGDGDRTEPGRRHARTLFLARLAAGCAAISLVTIVAQWAPAWFLSPCH